MVSVSSGLSASTVVGPIPPAKAKACRKAQLLKNALKEKAGPSKLDYESVGDAILDFPGNTQSPKESQRVSMSPLYTREDSLEPTFSGTDHEKLRACGNALNTANHAARPTIINDRSSKFASNIRAVSTFLDAVVGSNGQHGGEAGEPTALYVCGAPGLGKTSGVKWCCINAVKSANHQASQTKVCNINAGFLAKQTSPLQCVLSELGGCLGTKAAKPPTKAIKKMLKSSEDKPNKTLIILVVDEIDALVSGRDTSTAGEACLRTLLAWANDPVMQIALIGISNCMNDAKTDRILELGSVSRAQRLAWYSTCKSHFHVSVDENLTVRHLYFFSSRKP